MPKIPKPISTLRAKGIQTSIQHRHIARSQSKSMQAHEQIARMLAKENLAPKSRQPYSKDTRHRERGYMKLCFDQPFETSHSIHMQDIICQISNGRLANEIGKKAYPEMIIEVFRALNPESFSAEHKLRADARDEVMQTLNLNAKAIWPMLWLEKTPTAETVINAIRARRHILHFFTSPAQLEGAENFLTTKTKFPGWLALSSNEALLRKVYEKHGRFTANQLFTQKITEKGETKNVYSKLQQTIERLRKMKIEEDQAESEIIGSTRQIATRVLVDPSKVQLPKEYRQTGWKTNADSLISNSFNYHTIIATLPGPLEIAKMPNGSLAAVIMAGKGILLCGLTHAEQEFARPKYEVEIARKKAERNRKE